MAEVIADSSNRGPSQSGYDRPFGDLKQSKSVVLGRNGMVATSHPLAASAAIDVLRNGGNACDAAIAANAMLGVVEPASCGIGGDVFCLYFDKSSEKVFGLNGSGRSPHNISREVFEKKGLQHIPEDSILSWSIPGCVSGWASMNEKFGSKTLDELLLPSIRVAERGFGVSEIIAGAWQGTEERLREHKFSAKTYLIDDEQGDTQTRRAPRFGEWFQNPRLAATYRKLADAVTSADSAQGAVDEFYRGSIAKEIVAFSDKHGGCLSLQDFADHRSEWVEPVASSYRGFDVWQIPPPGQGIATLQILNILEQFDIGSMKGVDVAHLFIEAKKLAFADRAKLYSDPKFRQSPVKQLISKEYAKERASLIDLKKAADDSKVDAGINSSPPPHGDTVYVTVVDKHGNCCSLIQSVYFEFGSKIVPGNVGFCMQNRGSMFSLDPQHANSLEPHKLPFHTIIPSLVTRNNKPVYCFGNMGGGFQPQGQTWLLMNLIDLKMNVQLAIDTPRIRHMGGSTPMSGIQESVVYVESGFDEATLSELRRRGHNIIVQKGHYGGAQVIYLAPNNVLHAGSDARKDGCALPLLL